MADVQMFQIDAFTGELFAGNPAAVCPLDEWLPDTVMQAIAGENNLAETAFFVPEADHFELRWFTPLFEVRLCGHATLACAYVLFNDLPGGHERAQIRFETLSGPLFVRRDPADGTRLVMDFPSWPLRPVTDPPAALLQGLRATPAAILQPATADNFFVVFDQEEIVCDLEPDFDLLAKLHPAGVVATAPGRSSDCASRYFIPSYGVAEDPATGSIHCGLTPFWAERLGKRHIHARQVSKRGAELFCEDRGERVSIAGHAVKYMSGRIHL